MKYYMFFCRFKIYFHSILNILLVRQKVFFYLLDLFLLLLVAFVRSVM